MRDIGIVGAGPYGLSLAAHLQATRSDFRIFGTPMQTWATRMPKGMNLKSEGFASTLYDGAKEFSFAHYCRQRGIAYTDIGTPVSVADFADYGVAFQKRFVPNLERKEVRGIARQGDGFELRLDTGETAHVRRVVLAVGITHFARTIPVFEGLPADLVTHSSAHHDMARFADKTVAVVGGGSSATDCAASLLAAGAKVHLVTRAPSLKFYPPPRRITVLEYLRWPLTKIGSGWRAVFYSKMPLVFHAMSQRFRHDVARRYLGAKSDWTTRDIIERQAGIHLAAEVQAAEAKDGRVALVLRGDGEECRLEVDHVIAATGYRVDLDRLGFLDAGLRAEIRAAEKTPVLSRVFESSVPGLFFVGVASTHCFGPLVRFACGAEFTAGRLARHLARTAKPVRQDSQRLRSEDRDDRHLPADHRTAARAGRASTRS